MRLGSSRNAHRSRSRTRWSRGGCHNDPGDDAESRLKHPTPDLDPKAL